MSEHAAAATAHPKGPLAHQFDDLEQQHEASLLGMWVFLVTEVMFFGGLFTGYTVYRTSYPEAFVAGSRRLDLVWGFINTMVLIASSLTMAMAVHAAQVGRRRALIGFLLATMVLGSVFLGVKAYEYHHKWEEQLVPGHFQATGPLARQMELYFSFYFAMTGMHALHMVVGLGILTFLVVMASKGRFTPEHHSHVEICGLYWHFVDIIWIFLFPLLYLLGAMR